MPVPTRIATSLRTRAWSHRSNWTLILALSGLLFGSIQASGQAPSNDHFAQRTRIDDGRTSWTGTLYNSTLEASETDSAADQGSVWFEWVVPRSGRWTIRLSKEGLAGRTSVWRSTDSESLETYLATPALKRATDLVAAERLIVRIVGPPLYPFEIHAVLPPDNDDFAQARALEGETVSTEVDAFTASLEPGEWEAQENSLGTIWYRWIAPRSGAFEVTSSLLGSPGFSYWDREQLALIQATSASDVTWSRYTTTRPLKLGLQAVANQAYYLRLRMPADYWITGNVQIRPAPANNDFAGRTQITGTQFSERFYSVEDFGEPGEPRLGPALPWASAWWEWTCPQSGGYELRSEREHVVGVFRGRSLDQLETEIVSREGRVAFYAEAGSRWILMTDRPAANTSIQGTLSLKPTALNDAFERAEVLSGLDASTDSWGRLSTRQPGEPSGVPAERGSLWFRWRAPASASFGLTFGSGRIRVYEGSVLSQLTLLAESSPATNGPGQLSFTARAGVDYSFSLETPEQGDWEASTTTGITLTVARPNDQFEARVTVPQRDVGPLYEIPASAVGSSWEAGEPTPDSLAQTGSVWFRWVAPTSGSFHVWILRLTSIPKSIAVYRGTELTQLQTVPPLRHRFDKGLEDYRFPAEAGIEYAIRVAGVGDINGFTLSLAPSPIHDDFRNRKPLVGSTVSDQVDSFGATRESLDPPNGLFQTVWWGWTAPDDGVCHLNLDALIAGPNSQNAFLSMVPIQGGNPSFPLGTALEYFTNRAALNVDVVAGQEYAVVGSGGILAQTLSLNLEFHSAQATRLSLGIRRSTTGPDIMVFESFATTPSFTIERSPDLLHWTVWATPEQVSSQLRPDPTPGVTRYQAEFPVTPSEESVGPYFRVIAR